MIRRLPAFIGGLSPFIRALLLLIGVGVFVALLGFTYLLSTGLKARDEPGAIETFFALGLRNFIIGWHAKNLRNPVERGPEVIAEGRAHFADHCANCHANDGSGETEMGQGLYPKPPDLRLRRTQNLTDGALFYIIENGVRLTGMPAWGTGTEEGEMASWRLVHFIRHLPDVSEPELAEMESLNPASPEEIQQRLLEQQFLQGEEPAGTSPTMPQHKGGHQ